ncbi:hypothetical protein [Tuwongella immobilis]|uniref:Uncharacterized protein n=1 Tax=Tuwongella immobilis TaxID=692036 RepID=A0A6C2YKX5_9BACT|nr:hypothetical protein [Tuwongella immobilis]VIP01879.1 unnamed protein product [Tuwongella immobilis]VTR99725.1 unnamed protein product [Tuwongella immobilis]
MGHHESQNRRQYRRIILGGIILGGVSVGSHAIRADAVAQMPQHSFDWSARLAATDDPGAVAEHRAAEAMSRSDWWNAEADYRRVLADAALPADRRRRAWFNLGVALTRRSEGKQSDPLRAAITCFQNVRDDPATPPEWREAAKLNLELSKRLWNQAQIDAAQSAPPDAGSPTANGLPEVQSGQPNGDAANDPPPGNDPQMPQNDPQSTGPRAEGPGTELPKAPTPGAGNLPVLPDTDALLPISPEQLAGYLQADARRLTEQRRQQSRLAAESEKSHANGW